MQHWCVDSARGIDRDAIRSGSGDVASRGKENRRDSGASSRLDDHRLRSLRQAVGSQSFDLGGALKMVFGGAPVRFYLTKHAKKQEVRSRPNVFFLSKRFSTQSKSFRTKENNVLSPRPQPLTQEIGRYKRA